MSITGTEILGKHGKTIAEMCSRHADFRELWGDYLEVARAIQAEGLRSSQEIELGRLRAALEAEILEILSLSVGSAG